MWVFRVFPDSHSLKENCQVSNARIMNRGTSHNIMTQLAMTADDYNLVTVMYYVSLQVFKSRSILPEQKHQIPYIVGEAPSNLLLKRFSPSKWQSRIMITWGIVLACHCAVTNKSGLYAARFFLGLVCYKPPPFWESHLTRIG